MPGVTWLIVLGVAVVTTAIVLTLVFRLARFSAHTRRLVAFRGTVESIATQTDASLGVISEAVDAVRRGSLAALDMAVQLGEAMTSVEQLAERARQLGHPPGSEPIRQGLIDDLERAGRALDMIQHGCSLLAGPRSREQEPEAQTAIKRGYLNLLHARESLARHAAAAQDLQVTVPRLFAQPPGE